MTTEISSTSNGAVSEMTSKDSPAQLELLNVETHDAKIIKLVSDALIAVDEYLNEERAEQNTDISDVEETQQAENAIRPASVKATAKVVDEVKQVASSGDNKIIKATPSTEGQTMTIKSPVQLLNKRFVLGENGEYRRLGETRVALVDEIEQIRFIDKQMDAFQAGVELAKLKGWQAIEVTGTEKFRSEAWFHARMAGLEVVGYETNDSDLKRLAVAQTSQKLIDNSMEDSLRQAAIYAAMKNGVGVHKIDKELGCYSGPIIRETEHHFVQDLGRNVAVLHDKNCFNRDALSEVLKGGGSLKIQYESGHAVASKVRDRGHGLSR